MRSRPWEAVAVHLQRAAELCQPSEHALRGEVLSARGLPHDRVGEVAAVGVLHDDGERLLALEGAVEAGDVGVLERGEDQHLGRHLVELLRESGR